MYILYFGPPDKRKFNTVIHPPRPTNGYSSRINNYNKYDCILCIVVSCARIFRVYLDLGPLIEIHITTILLSHSPPPLRHGSTNYWYYNIKKIIMYIDNIPKMCIRFFFYI